MRIYLVGYMGSGKSTLGKQLSSRMKLPFVDLDKVIEEEEGREVIQIFRKDGEATFRGMERKYLKKVTEEHENCVVAVGGGTPCFYDNMAYMKTNGITVYLQMDAASLAYRIYNGKSKRPLTDGKSEAELKEFIKGHLEEREDMYKDAHITVSALGFNARKMEELISMLETHSR